MKSPSSFGVMTTQVAPQRILTTGLLRTTSKGKDVIPGDAGTSAPMIIPHEKRWLESYCRGL